MPFVSAKCPNCGGEIQLDESKESGFCMHCGSKVIVQEAIQKFKLEISGQVSLSGISSVENDLELGKQYLDAKDWKNAYKIYCGAVDKKANYFDAWMGCLTAMTQNFEHIDASWASFDGGRGIEAVLKNCIKYCDAGQKQDLLDKIQQLRLSFERMKKDNNERLKNGRNKGISKVFTGVVIVGFGSLFIFANNDSDSSLAIFFLCLLAGLITIVIGLIQLLFNANEKNMKPELLPPYYTYGERIQAILTKII